jgi:hypothetical protein
MEHLLLTGLPVCALSIAEFSYKTESGKLNRQPIFFPTVLGFDVAKISAPGRACVNR